MRTIDVTQSTIDLHVTTDYEIFKKIKGNRPVDKQHVAQLKRKIENEGNLTSEFPVNLNENMEVIDGQNRILALQELGYPVYYTISEGASLATVRQINIGRKNWSWSDYASSFASEGNPHYKDLLDFHEAFNFPFSTLVRYCYGGKRIAVSEYQSGDFKVLDKGMTFKLLNQLVELREVLPFPLTGSVASALYDIQTHPDYDHKRMLKKLTTHGSQLHEWRQKKDWLRNLEDIYNLGYGEAGEVRFF